MCLQEVLKQGALMQMFFLVMLMLSGQMSPPNRENNKYVLPK